MGHLIEAVRHIIHGRDFEHAEAWFVESTRSLYKAVILGLLLIIAVIGAGIACNVYDHKEVNFFLWIASMTLITILALYGRYVFRVAVAGTVYGAARSNVSGIQSSVDFLKKYFAAVRTVALILTGIFSALTIINFSWFSATIGIFAFAIIGLSGFKKTTS